MMERIPFQSYGPAPFAPEAGTYAMLPNELWGELGRHTQNGLKAILAALMINGPLVSKTEASRQDLLDLIPEDKRPKDKRSITGYFARLIELGVIARTRIKGTNVWITELIKPFQARPDEPPAAEVKPRTPKSEVAEPRPLSAKEAEKWCNMAVTYCQWIGWRLVPLETPGDLGKEPIEGREQSDPPGDMIALLKERRKLLWEFLRGNHQRE